MGNSNITDFINSFAAIATTIIAWKAYRTYANTKYIEHQLAAIVELLEYIHTHKIEIWGYIENPNPSIINNKYTILEVIKLENYQNCHLVSRINQTNSALLPNCPYHPLLPIKIRKAIDSLINIKLDTKATDEFDNIKSDGVVFLGSGNIKEGFLYVLGDKNRVKFSDYQHRLRTLLFLVDDWFKKNNVKHDPIINNE